MIAQRRDDRAERDRERQPRAAWTSRRSKRRPNGALTGGPRHQQPELALCRSPLASSSPTMRPAYMTAMRSASIEQLVEVLGDQQHAGALARDGRRAGRAPTRWRRRRARAWARRRRAPSGSPRARAPGSPSGALPPESRRAGVSRARARGCRTARMTSSACARIPPAAQERRALHRRAAVGAGSTRFSAIDRLGARPVCMRSSGTWPSPGGDRRARVARGQARARRRRAVPAVRGRVPGDHLGQLALPVAGDARDAEDLARAHGQRDVVQRGDARGRPRRRRRRAPARRPRRRRPRRSRRSKSTSRPTISAGELGRARVARCAPCRGLRAGAQDRRRGRRRAITSLSLCVTKMTVLPSPVIRRSAANSPSDSCGVSIAVGSSRISTRASR